MATYTSSLKLLLPVDGDLSWGSAVNNNVTSLVDIAVAGYTDVTMTDADRALTYGNGATANESRYAFINMISSPLTAARNVIVPTLSKLYYIKNSTTGGFAITVKTSAGTGISVLNGTVKTLMCNGTDVIEATSSSVGTSTTTQVLYNSSGVAVGSANLIFDGTSLAVNGVKVGRGLNSIVSNTAVGNNALAATIAGSTGSTAIGNNALAVQTSGINNTAIGLNALAQSIVGGNNVAVGAYAGWRITDYGNTAIGTSALISSVTGASNTAVGASAFSNNNGGGSNVAIGSAAGLENTSGNFNVFVGGSTGTNIQGSSNVVVGALAGSVAASTGNNLVIIGALASCSSGTASNEITLGSSAIGTLRCAVTTITAISDARDKTNIQPLVPGLDFINRLNPVSFDWNMRDGGKVGIADTGFIAQDLQSCQTETEVIPGLVFTGNPDRLEAAYGKLLPVMVKAIQELTARIAVLEAR